MLPEAVESAIAMGRLREAIQRDEHYAWTWHCNIAMAFVDQGGSHEQANRAAACFMRNAFGVDMTKDEYYQQFEREWKNARKEA